MRLITAFTATALSAGMVVGGVHIASAAPDAGAANAAVSALAASDGITLPEGGVLEQRITTLCNRIPDLLVRVDKASTRLAADANTKGSIAWLEAKRDQAKKNGHPKVALHLDRVIERRTIRQGKLPEIKQRLTAAQGECATIEWPAATPTPSASGS